MHTIQIERRQELVTGLTERARRRLSASLDRLYVSNRGADTIATFAVDGTGDLALVDEVSCGGSWPRHFAIDGGVLFAANQKGNSVVSFRFDAEGLPRPTGDVVELDSPTCVLPR